MEFGKWRSERGGGGRGEKLTVSSESGGCEAESDGDANEGESMSASSSDESPPYEAIRTSIFCSDNGGDDGGAAEKFCFFETSVQLRNRLERTRFLIG